MTAPFRATSQCQSPRLTGYNPVPSGRGFRVESVTHVAGPKCHLCPRPHRVGGNWVYGNGENGPGRSFEINCFLEPRPTGAVSRTFHADSSARELFFAKSSHGVKARCPASRQISGDQSHQCQRSTCRCQNPGIVGGQSIEEASDKPRGSERHAEAEA
jgi:hypothetical protein